MNKRRKNSTGKQTKRQRNAATRLSVLVGDLWNDTEVKVQVQVHVGRQPRATIDRTKRGASVLLLILVTVLVFTLLPDRTRKPLLEILGPVVALIP